MQSTFQCRNDFTPRIFQKKDLVVKNNLSDDVQNNHRFSKVIANIAQAQVQREKKPLDTFIGQLVFSLFAP